MTNPASHDNEILDVVDENDNIIGSEGRETIHLEGLRHREIHVWFFDDKKNIYFQKSGPTRPSAGLLDATVGGHMNRGEKYIDAAVRETREELGISAAPDDLELLFKFSGLSEYRTNSKKNNFFRAIFIYKKPIKDEEITTQGDPDSLGIHKLPIDFLLNCGEEDRKIFHKFLPNYELPYVLKYIANI